MNGECRSSRNRSSKDANAVLFSTTYKTIYLIKGEIQCRNFLRGADGGIHDVSGRERVIKSVNDIDRTSSLVHRAFSLTLLPHLLDGQHGW